ncbi:alanine--tRNA ligase-related protein [Streptomyces sp. NPDC056528]|uniref:alanine--tRNA ligase-related protein n=1 Tax=Streptomyces sp. NPDC056528 TaxID=3345854 RepID=UPI0036C2B643
MSQEGPAYGAAAARDARDRLDGWAEEFVEWFRDSGAERLTAEPAVPTTDRTILFTNSAVVPFKPFIRGDVPFDDRWVTVRQPCIRSHNLRATFVSDFHTEFVLRFEMLGAMAPASHLDDFVGAIAGYFGTRLGLDGAGVAFKAHSDHHDLSGAWARAWKGPIGYDGESDKFYNWTFGDDGMTGRGATFCLVQPDGHWRDLGNLIAFEWHGETVAYGFGIGLETLAAGLTAGRWVIDSTPEGRFHHAATPQEAKLADLVGLLVQLYKAGIVVSNRAQGYIMRKTLVYVERLAGRLGVPDEVLVGRLAGVAAVEAPGLDVEGPFLAHLEQLRRDPVATRTVDLSFLCDAALGPEVLCGAVEEGARPGLLGLEARVADVWQGPSLPAGRRSVTLGLTLTSATRLEPTALRALLREITDELSDRFGAVLRGTLPDGPGPAGADRVDGADRADRTDRGDGAAGA